MSTCIPTVEWCRKPGANACRSQTTLQQVITQPEVVDEIEAPVTSKLYVGGMCCPSEVPIINSALGKLQGVIKASKPFKALGAAFMLCAFTAAKGHCLPACWLVLWLGLSIIQTGWRNFTMAAEQHDMKERNQPRLI